MNGYQIFRFVCLVLLWLIMVWFVVAYQPLTLRVVFIVVASGIIVFVPVYKKYVKQRRNKS